MAEKDVLKKGSANFEFIGKAKISQYTFKIDEKSKTSDWIYNKLNLLVDCGNGNEVTCELMGGYGKGRKNVLYVHGKKLSENSEEGKEKYIDDFDNQYTIAWEDRDDDNILSEIGEKSFKRVGVEIDTEGKIVTKKFLSPYDLIAYVNENKDKIDGATVRVQGTIKYKKYNGNLQKVKEIDSIYLSKVE